MKSRKPVHAPAIGGYSEELPNAHAAPRTLCGYPCNNGARITTETARVTCRFCRAQIRRHPQLGNRVASTGLGAES